MTKIELLLTHKDITNRTLGKLLLNQIGYRYEISLEEFNKYAIGKAYYKSSDDWYIIHTTDITVTDDIDDYYYNKVIISELIGISDTSEMWLDIITKFEDGFGVSNESIIHQLRYNSKVVKNVVKDGYP